MAFEQPLMRQEKRMAQPTSVFGRFHCQGNLGTGLGLKAHGMTGFPKVGANVTPRTSGIGMGIKPLRAMAGGTDGDDMDYGGFGSDFDWSNAGSNPIVPTPSQLNVPQMAQNLQSQGVQPQDWMSAQQQSALMPSTPNVGIDASSLPNQTPAFQGVNAPQRQSSGPTGKQWMNAGITALTGILSNIANGQLTKSAGNIISKAQANPNMGAHFSAPSIRRAEGGIIPSYATGGMSTGDCYDQGGMPQGGQNQQQGTPQGGQNVPSANNPASQMITAQAIKALLGQSQNPQSDIQQFVQHFGPQALQALVAQVKQSQGAQNAQGQAPQGQGISQGQNAPAMQPGASNGQQMASGIAPGMASGGMTGSRDQDGMLSGPGDGMSDDIHANGSQVRVADGEFVLDGSTVSQIGNGSSKAGAQKITQAVKALRQKKFGSTKQPPKVKDYANPMLKTISGQ